MPFTKKEDREKVDRIVALQNSLDEMRKTLKPGDRCFNHYRSMVREFAKDRRWTTVDTLAKAMFADDELRAYFLAFLQFYVDYALPYEEEKREANGDIE